MRCLLGLLTLVLFAGCRSQTTAMTNPFLAPNRVPPPATRTLLPGTAQPYYPGDPVPNSPAINAPPVGFAPGTPQPVFQPTTPTYAPQPAGAVPPGGWNGAPQQIPNGSSSRNVLPSNIQPANALVPDPSILPTPPLAASPYPNQVATYQAPSAQQPFTQQAIPAGESREVRIRAISSANLDSNNGASASRDGFRPQGSSRVRKPTMVSRLMPRKREPVSEPSDRFGFDPQYSWLRGQLQHSAETGQWTLQYVPSQGSADQFGGNLTIANPQVLGSLQPGDYVQLRGQVDPAPGTSFNDTGRVAPIYSVSVVQRQRI